MGNVICILLVSHLLKVNFPEDRAAMHLYLLFIGGFIFTLDQLTERFKKSYLLGGLAFYFPLFLSFISHLETLFFHQKSAQVLPFSTMYVPQNARLNFCHRWRI